VLQAGLDYIEEVEHVGPKYAEAVGSNPQNLSPGQVVNKVFRGMLRK
jgi:hypothetical protein